MEKTVIKYKGKEVDCYGEWREDSNCLIVGDWADGSELEEFYCDGGENWTDVVRKLIDAPALEGAEIYELSAC
jgi:hypothetical protein